MPRAAGMQSGRSVTAQGENEGEKLERREPWVQPFVQLELLSRSPKCEGSGNRAYTFSFQGSWWRKETILEAVACCGQGREAFYKSGNLSTIVHCSQYWQRGREQ